jgi:dihydropyrimidinase
MSSANTILIRNGTLVTSECSFPADVRIEGERIVEVGRSLSGTEESLVINATGLLVLPGGVDPHVHLSRRPSLPPEACEGDDFLSGSQAAAGGGVTTVGEIASPEDDEGVLDTIDRVEAEVFSKSMVDVFVHPVLGSATRKLEQISKLPYRGQPSLKIFLMDPTLAEDPASLRRAVQHAAEAKVAVLFHCEAHSELSAAREALRQQGKTSLRYLPESRPVSAEVRATEQAINLCRTTGATGHIVHISCAQALALCSEARAQGLPLHTETRPEFLLLTTACHRGEDAKLHVMIPPLREDADREALWRGLGDRSLDLVATDDAAFWPKAQKLAAPDSFEELRMGLSGLELFRPLLFSEGVRKGRISAERFVEITATAAAQIFGLYPRKGTIAVGADADLVLWDPQETRTVSADDLISLTGFTIYEGWRVTGWPRMTLRRGEIVYRDGEICASPGSGTLVDRRTVQSCANRP